MANILRLLRVAAQSFGLDIHRIPRASSQIPDADLYQPTYSPWLGRDFENYFSVAAPKTLVTRDRCYVLCSLLKQALSIKGEVAECGVYQGGTAAMLAKIIQEKGAQKILYLFDTFDGMPATDARRDLHRSGDFSDTSEVAVKAFVNAPAIAITRRGMMPATFAGLEHKFFSFAHIDVDIYQSVLDCLDFIWPRLSAGGIIVLDDYGLPGCPGARQAVDEFFADLIWVPLCLPTGQAIIFKS